MAVEPAVHAICATNCRRIIEGAGIAFIGSISLRCNVALGGFHAIEGYANCSENLTQAQSFRVPAMRYTLH